MANGGLIFKDAVEARDAITESQKQEIVELYKKWSDEIGEKVLHLSYSNKWNSSSIITLRQSIELKKMIEETGSQVSSEIEKKIKSNLYLISDAVVQSNVNWLKELGFDEKGLNAAFSTVANNAIQNLITGQIYESGWSLSKRIWSDNEQTMKDCYQIVAKGMAENMPIYQIAKELQTYVTPGAKKGWNPILKMKNTQTGKYEYKRIYKGQVDYNAQRLARTLAQHSYQQSLLATTKNNPFITDYVWNANGSRVCPLCADRDGKHFKKDELPMDHPNGMCVIEPTVADDMTDQLAEWFNSPDGTFPEIDEFASNFGYEAAKSGSVQDFISKYGTSTKSPSAWYNSLSPEQKEFAKKLKDESGLTWNEFYKQSGIYQGDGSNLTTKKKTKTKNDDDLKSAVDAAKAKLESFGNKTYSGIWKEDVTLADYAGKADKIEAKRKYYLSQIEKYSGDAYANSPWASTEIVKLKKYLDDLDEFEKLGKEYMTYQKVYKDALSAYNKVNFKSGFSADAWSDAVKNAAYKFTSRDKADKFYREYLDSVWDQLSDEQKYSVWEYTRNSNPINKSLSGYHDSWDRSYFLGLGKTDLGHEDAWRSIDVSAFSKFEVNGHVSYKKVVGELTKAIDKVSLQQDVYLVRGSDNNGLAGLLEGNLLSFTDAQRLLGKDEASIKSVLVGQVFRNDAFTSTGIADDSGFSGSVAYRIFAPAGTKGIYAEPQSYYGYTSANAMYTTGKAYSYVGGEAEVILQRGTEFRITNVTKNGSQIVIDMEVVKQPDYFDTGIEHTHNDGKTSYKK